MKSIFLLCLFEKYVHDFHYYKKYDYKYNFKYNYYKKINY